mmetsp:Transcript_15188/g.30033  ORF Transcript_15188/g.30033 Transcript_15188/m.30033 type:complete len:354 (-) Transcript_15188:370-1431(-)
MFKHPLHVFEGLEGLATNLIARTPKRQKDGSEEAGGTSSRDQRQSPSRQEQRSSQSRQARTAATTARSASARADSPFAAKLAAGHPMSRPLDKLSLLKELTLRSPSFTIMHDLSTPNRSYIFGDKSAQRSATALPWDHEANTRKRDDLIRSLDQKYSMHKIRVHTSRRENEEAALQAMIRSSSTGQRSRMSTHHTSHRTTPKAQKRAVEESMLSSLGLTEADMPNELAGPFRGEDGRMQMPTVKQMSTFEDYLERTVNSVRQSPIRFDDSVKQLDRKQFKPRWMRRGIETPPPPVDEASMMLVKRAERAATSLGFAPSREVVGMHRERPPWQIDPSIYVRAGMASFGKDASLL